MDSISVSHPNIRKAISDGVLAIIFLLVTEAMLFAGLISAYIVNRAGAAAMWPPADQPRLPVEVTGFNTIVLISSAFVLYLFTRRVNRFYLSINFGGTKTTSLLLISILLGAAFLIIQGSEWAKMIGYGLTAHSSIYGAFFYTIIGIHGVHVLAGLSILLYLYFAVKNATSYQAAKNKIAACTLYWYFVVAIWPILYRLVYFN
jgi:heme/copper-type cytochrome/quinol oxidase subunit 3